MRSSSLSLLTVALALAGCGGGSDGGGGDPVRYSAADVRAHFKKETGLTLAVLANDSPVVAILGPPDEKAVKRYGSFTANVAKTEGAIKALQKSHLGTQKRFANVVVDWISTTGADRRSYERSLAVFESLDD